MEKVGAYAAKTHLSSLLDKVAKGERIIITKHGIPKAEMIPIISTKTSDPKVIIKELKSLRKNLTLGRLSVRKMIDHGRRF